MGYDATCSLRIDGRTVHGTALLETKELIFRGPTRIVIPFHAIESAVARDGTLYLAFGGRGAELELGAQAGKWARRMTNPPSRLDKLGVKSGMRVLLRADPDGVLLEELRARGAHVSRAARGTFDIIFHPAPDRRALAALPSLVPMMKPAGALWVVRPKGQPSITEAETMHAGRAAGLVDVKVVSFSETHTAEKFVIPVARRAGPRPRALKG